MTRAGGTEAASIAEAVRDADVVITMVPASPQVEAVAYGPDGILEHARAAAQLVASAVACGDGELDHSALLRGVQRLSGYEVGDAEPESA